MIRIQIRKIAQYMVLATCFSTVALAQSTDAESPKKAPENWFNLDPTTDKVYGVSTEKAYSELLKGKTPKPVIVAVIDGGVDVNHEDLKDVIWTNPKEIVGNGIDDDKNGYIDDVHGWNFIGGKDSSVHYDNLEVTRLYRSLKAKFDKADTTRLSAADQKEFDRFRKIREEYEKESQEAQGNYFGYKMLQDALINMKKKIGKDEVTVADIQGYKATDPVVEQAKQITEGAMSKGMTFNQLLGELDEAVKYFQTKALYHTNVDYDPRPTVGDNYADANERKYGNNDVTGPSAEHGTHVAGIIAAMRDNNLGMKGVANANVAKILVVRTVPDGDERDKDVANSIRYAVDNGAKVINMSFGKSYSWNKQVVDDAIKYAASKDVLLVHAAGNDHQNNDQEHNYPNDEDASAKEYVNNWVEVGASSWEPAEKGLGSFSNYGKKSVDVFAPGVAIYSTVPGSKYENNNGTSMASPVVAGVAALIRAYYPKLTAPQVKQILMKSVVPYPGKVLVPGSENEQVSLSDISQTGGIVNAYEALKMAQKMGKK